MATCYLIRGRKLFFRSVIDLHGFFRPCLQKKILRSKPMTNTQIELVQTTFKSVQPIAETAAELFYKRLFEIDPSLRPMFRGDMQEQGRKLMQMLAVAVAGLTRFDQLLPAVEDMGRRHAGYGVRDEHYATVAQALLWTLEQGLGPAFTSEVREAWTTMYVAIATAMQRGAAAGALRAVAAD
jgi:hemoglobin-like flavoprotein